MIATKRVRIEDLVIEQFDILEEYDVSGVKKGLLKYGRDYNRLKAIMFHHKDKDLVNQITVSLEDKELLAKVKLWMEK